MIYCAAFSWRHKVTIFDYLKDIIVTKKGDLSLDEYVPFLVNRWLSFINPKACEAINNVNCKVLLEDKNLHYKTMLVMFPKMKYCPKIHYIKKAKKQTDKDNKEQLIKVMSHNLEISTREAALLLNEL